MSFIILTNIYFGWLSLSVIHNINSGPGTVFGNFSSRIRQLRVMSSLRPRWLVILYSLLQSKAEMQIQSRMKIEAVLGGWHSKKKSCVDYRFGISHGFLDFLFSNWIGVNANTNKMEWMVPFRRTTATQPRTQGTTPAIQQVQNTSTFVFLFMLCLAKFSGDQTIGRTHTNSKNDNKSTVALSTIASILAYWLNDKYKRERRITFTISRLTLLSQH